MAVIHALCHPMRMPLFPRLEFISCSYKTDPKRYEETARSWTHKCAATLRIRPLPGLTAYRALTPRLKLPPWLAALSPVQQTVLPLGA